MRCGVTARHLTTKCMNISIKGLMCGECSASWKGAKGLADNLPQERWYSGTANDVWRNFNNQSVRKAFSVFVTKSAEHDIIKV